MNSTALDLLKPFHPCCPDYLKDKTPQEAWEQCNRGDWMLWAFGKLFPEHLQELTLAKGKCAETVLHLMKDQRSIDAVKAAIDFGEGRLTEKELRKYADAANTAAAYAAFAASAAPAADADAAAAAAAADAAAVAAVAAADAADAAHAAAVSETAYLETTADICRKYLPFADLLKTLAIGE